MKPNHNCHLQNKVKNLCLVLAFVFISQPVFAISKTVEEAIALLKQSHFEQCQRNKLKVQLLVAHRKHDQALLKELEVKLDEINKILQPTEDKLDALKAKIKQNPDEENEFNTALLDVGSCE